MTRFQGAKRIALMFPIVCAGFLVLNVADARAQANQWGFGTDLGFTSGTVNGTVFTLGFNLDYYLDRNFSFGPMMLLSPTGDLTQIAIAGAARYHLRFDNGMNLVPFAGIGLVHASLDTTIRGQRVDSNDTSHFIPLGLSLEYQASRSIALSSTLLVSLQHLTLDAPAPVDNTSVSLLFGIRWGP
jgi:hypothetical protein